MRKTQTINIQPIEQCTIGQFRGKTKSNDSTETWFVTLTGSQKLKGYLKLSNNSRQTIAEVITASCGRAIGLNIPEPRITLIDAHKLPTTSSFKNKNNHWAFVSISAGDNISSFARLTLSLRGTHIINRWRGIHETIAFDEWIANDDRNPENLLYDSSSSQYWLIDQGNALFKIPDNMPHSSTYTDNLLVKHSQPIQKSFATKQYEHTERIVHECKKLAFSSLNIDTIRQIDETAPIERVLDFLSERINHTQTLLCEKIGLPMLNMATISNDVTFSE